MSDSQFWSLFIAGVFYIWAATILAPTFHARNGRKPLVTLVVSALWLPLCAIASAWLALSRVTGGQR